MNEIVSIQKGINKVIKQVNIIYLTPTPLVSKSHLLNNIKLCLRGFDHNDKQLTVFYNSSQYYYISKHYIIFSSYCHKIHIYYNIF